MDLRCDVDFRCDVDYVRYGVMPHAMSGNVTDEALWNVVMRTNGVVHVAYGGVL